MPIEREICVMKKLKMDRKKIIVGRKNAKTRCESFDLIATTENVCTIRKLLRMNILTHSHERESEKFGRISHFNCMAPLLWKQSLHLLLCAAKRFDVGKMFKSFGFCGL